MPGERKSRLPSTVVTDTDKGVEDSEEVNDEGAEEETEAVTETVKGEGDTTEVGDSVFEKEAELKADHEDDEEGEENKEEEGDDKASARTVSELALTPMGSTADSVFRSDDPEDYYYTPRKKEAPVVEKIVIDYTKPENNVSIKYLKKHRKNMTLWKKCTLKTLIDEQDCAVEAVKLEWLLKSDMVILNKR